MKFNPHNRSPRRFTGNLHRVVFWVIIGLFFAVVFAVVFGIVVKLLWGVTLTPIFGLPEITYWQAVGIVILARLIFGGFGHRSKDKSDKRWNQGWDRWGKSDDVPPMFKRMHDRFHGIDSEEADDDADIPEKDLEHYNDFWEKEGKQAFEDYISRQKQE